MDDLIFTGIFVGHCACNGEDWIEAFQNDSIQNHLSVARLHFQVGQVVTHFTQILERIKSVHLLPKHKHVRTNVNNNKRMTCDVVDSNLEQVDGVSNDEEGRWFGCFCEEVSD